MFGFPNAGIAFRGCLCKCFRWFHSLACALHFLTLIGDRQRDDADRRSRGTSQPVQPITPFSARMSMQRIISAKHWLHAQVWLRAMINTAQQALRSPRSLRAMIARLMVLMPAVASQQAFSGAAVGACTAECDRWLIAFSWTVFQAHSSLIDKRADAHQAETGASDG